MKSRPVDALVASFGGRWGSRLSQLQRDLRMIARAVRGERANPLVDRRPGGRSAPPPPPEPRARAITPRPVTLVEVVRETADAVSLYLAPEDGSELTHLPGQFLSFDVEVDGQVLRRAYSLANPALPGARPHVTVKRVAGGRVSNHLNDHAAPGQTLRVLGPSGDFVVHPDPQRQRKLVLIAGGSGITPIISIAETVLATEPSSQVVLIYGNRSLDDVIFRQRLEDLARRYAPRFVVDHVLEEADDDWTGARGRLDAQVTAERLDAVGLSGDDVAYYVCGPTPMREAVRQALTERGAREIHEERFHSPEDRTERDVPRAPQPVTIVAGGKITQARAEAGQTLLDAGLAAGLPMPFSCAMGGCGACRVRLREGEVQSDEPNCLTEQERAEGFVLACCSRPLTPVRVELP